MSKIEFFLLIPAIIYGVAIVDLLKIFKHRKIYWEVTLWGVVLMISIILGWIELFNKLDNFVESNVNFFILIIQSILTAQIVAVITPEDNDIDTKKYFSEERKLFFALGIIILIVNTLAEFTVFEDNRFWLRIINLPLFVACYFIDNKWLRTSVAGFLLIVGGVFLFS